MKSGPCWEPRCSRCDHTNGQAARWQKQRPKDAPERCGWCLADGLSAVWEYSLVKPTGFTAFVVEPEFSEYYSASLATTISSRKHLKHLQNKHGMMDAVVKGDASKTLIPRDLDRRVKDHQEACDRMNNHWVDE